MESRAAHTHPKNTQVPPPGTWPRLLGAVYTNLNIQFKHIFFYMNRPSVLTKPVNPNSETASFLKPHPRLKWISLDPTDLANFGSRLKWKLANSKWRTTNYCLLGYCSLKVPVYQNIWIEAIASRSFPLALISCSRWLFISFSKRKFGFIVVSDEWIGQFAFVFLFDISDWDIVKMRNFG